MTLEGKRFLVETEPTKEVVVDGLTRDVDVKTCVFDLIDNSADAARDTARRNLALDDLRAVQNYYNGFLVDLTLSGEGLKLRDNCGGISVENLRQMVLRFGSRSTHEGGVGVFGVGLNRALFKLGRLSHLKTDTGTQRAELVLNVPEYLKSADWTLPAEQFASSSEIGTEIEIRDLPADIAQQFADRQWVDDLRHEIGRRYARFIANELAIRVNGVAVENEEVPIRDGGTYFLAEDKFFKSDAGVAIHIQCGQHRDHRFSKEPGWNLQRNAALSDQFGWTVFCNDRAVIMSDRSEKTGWDKQWHTEFNGFVGNVMFVDRDPAKLPWNTTKTDIDLNNEAYQRALGDMRRFVQMWRRQAGEQRKKGEPPRTVPAKSNSTADTSSTTTGPAVGTGRSTRNASPQSQSSTPPVLKQDHNQFRTVLPSDLDEKNCYDKHLHLIHEGKKLDLAELTYSGLALIRMLFESSVHRYLDRHGKFSDLKEFVVQRRQNKGMKMPAEEIKKLVSTFEEILAFLDNNPEIWGAKENYLRHSLQKMASHQKTLNSTLHNPVQMVGAPKAFEIRDEVLPMLRHLIET